MKERRYDDSESAKDFFIGFFVASGFTVGIMIFVTIILYIVKGMSL